MKTFLLPLTLIASIAACQGQALDSVALDGIYSGESGYTNSENVAWFNGHKSDESIYGDFDNPLGSTTIRYGTGILEGSGSNKEYFFLYVEAPLYAKNMIWEDLDWKKAISNTDPAAGLTEADVASYRAHHETHHKPGDMKLDFRGATGSEKVVFHDSNGNDIFKGNLAGDADGGFGLVGYKDSSDYLFDNNLATESLSLNRDIPMAFEFQFEIDPAKNQAIIDAARNGLDMHLSPERGLPVTTVPEPSSAALIAVAAGGLAFRRRRNA